MDRKFWDDLGGQTHQPDVLNDQGIDTRAVQEAQIFRGIIEFTGEDKGIERHVGLYPMAVAERRYLWEFLLGEVVGAQPGIEARETEEYRIGTVGHGSLEAIPSSGGSKQFGAFHVRHALPTGGNLHQLDAIAIGQ